MVDYSKGLIYKLCCNDPSVKDIYVGSTTNFIRRKCAHKTACNNQNKKSYVYKFIRDNGGWCNWSMVLVRKYNATNKMKLARKERKYIEKLGATLNSNTPSRTLNEVKELTSKRNREYKEANKEVIREQRKEYRKRNKNVIKERNKQYYEANREEIIKQMTTKIECECGSIINRSEISRHKKTQKHKDLMNDQ